MKVYESTQLRNLVVLGHGDTGKTTLVSALLYGAGSVNRLGSVDDGTAVPLRKAARADGNKVVAKTKS